jgi:hypothetical protein
MAPASGGDLLSAKPHDRLDYGSLSRPRVERIERFLATCEKSESCRSFPRYDHRVAAVLAAASAWAYSDAATMSAAIGKHGIDNECHHFSVSNDAMLIDANAFLVKSLDGNLAIVSFRGTPPENVIDWLVDASVMPTQFGGSGHVHGGFYNNVIAVWNVVADRLNEFVEAYQRRTAAEKKPGLPAIFLTGHSLGAAMAALAAAITFEDEDYRTIREHICGVYTYGQPMIGDRVLADQCEQRFGNITFRHVYRQDIVPRLPPRTTGEFRHFGVEYSSGASGWTRGRRPIRQLASLLLSLPVAGLAWAAKQLPYLAGIDFPWSIADHSPLNYLQTSWQGGLNTILAQDSRRPQPAPAAPQPGPVAEADAFVS